MDQWLPWGADAFEAAAMRARDPNALSVAWWLRLTVSMWTGDMGAVEQWYSQAPARWAVNR